MVRGEYRRALGRALFVLLLAAGSASAAPGYGKLAGVVVDPSGTPQMGATIWVAPENGSGPAPAQLLTNQRGMFASARLLPGFYSVRVTLAGFLPAIERHVRISSNLTTLLKIEVDSVFASLDRLRRPQQQTDAEEWKWVLRASAATRPVLQWLEGQVNPDEEAATSETGRKRRSRGRVELTSGARRPGSVSNLASSPATAFSYDQKVGHSGRLLLAGQVSYEHSAAAGMATMWLPSGEPGLGPETILVLRQSKLGPLGPSFRAMRMRHRDRLALGDRFLLHYGAEYVMVGLGSASSSLRPQAQLDVRMSPNWTASLLAAVQPGPGSDPASSVLQSALAELDGLPAVLLRNGHPVLEGGWHEELAVARRLSSRATLQGAVFHDRARHTAVFGRGSSTNPEFFQDFFSDGFLYDGGGSGSWGTRVAYRHKINDSLEIAAIYAWAGALSLEDSPASVNLRDALQMRYRHSLAARVSGRVRKTGTQVVASYKWLSGPAVSRQDAFGEAAYQLAPNLNLSVRQPLPSFLISGRWEALADFSNLLAQGYVPANGRDGRVVLMPAFRSFRGGVSFQF